MALCPNSIAIVEDDDCLRRALARLLLASGYDVETFETAAGVLSAAPRLRTKWMLLDCNLGRESGVKLAQRLVDQGFRFEFLLMTGSNDQSLIRDAVALGCAGFLRKPFSMSELLLAIDEASFTAPNRSARGAVVPADPPMSVSRA